jgi:hypothetical protein
MIIRSLLKSENTDGNTIAIFLPKLHVQINYLYVLFRGILSNSITGKPPP